MKPKRKGSDSLNRSGDGAPDRTVEESGCRVADVDTRSRADATPLLSGGEEVSQVADRKWQCNAELTSSKPLLTQLRPLLSQGRLLLAVATADLADLNFDLMFLQRSLHAEVQARSRMVD